MSLLGSQRRDQRRRLLVSWTREKSSPSSRAAAPATRAMAEYAPEAHPERQPAIATLLPTGSGGMAIVSAVILVALGSTIAIGVYEPLLDAVGRMAGGRFAGAVAALRACVDMRSALSLAGWLSQLLLAAAAVVALVVRQMRRHRRDDYRGRYRAWGWLAGLLVTSSCAAHLPLGKLAGIFMAEATGIALGPQGYGWWVTLAALALGAVSLWAVLPLHERRATAVWLAAALGAWGAAAGCAWGGTGSASAAIAIQTAWTLGSGLMAIAMLAAARSVIREVRGEAGQTSKVRRQSAASRAAIRPPAAAVAAKAESWNEYEADEQAAAADDGAEDGYTAGDFTDGSDAEDDHGPRHLSKAERKRLKKLARLNRVA